MASAQSMASAQYAASARFKDRAQALRPYILMSLR